MTYIASSDGVDWLKESLGQRLRRLRKTETDLSVEAFATHFNTTFSSIAKYERDEQIPPLDKLKAFADFYGVSLDYLTGRTDNPERSTPADVEGSHSLDEVTAAMAHRLKELSPRGRKIVERLIEEFEEEDRLERERADR